MNIWNSLSSQSFLPNKYTTEDGSVIRREGKHSRSIHTERGGIYDSRDIICVITAAYHGVSVPLGLMVLWGYMSNQRHFIVPFDFFGYEFPGEGESDAVLLA